MHKLDGAFAEPVKVSHHRRFWSDVAGQRAGLEMQPGNLFEHLLPTSWKTQVTAWLAEDTPSFDYGGYVVGEAHRKAFLFGKGVQPAVLAGVPFVNEVFSQLGCQCVS